MILRSFKEEFYQSTAVDFKLRRFVSRKLPLIPPLLLNTGKP